MFFNRKSDEENERIIAQRNLISSYKTLFKSEVGKEVLYDLMNKYHVLNSHKGDPYLEGQRSVILGILSQSNINLEEFNKLLEGN